MCIGGDFNVIWFPCECLGENRLCLAMVAFSKLIFDLGCFWVRVAIRICRLCSYHVRL